MATQYIETLIVGAGQAGLATGYHLKRRGRGFLILDANARVGDNWRQQWDTLRLYTPAKYDGLPGLPFPAARWHCPQKEEVGDYLERYALHFDLPVRTSTEVDGLESRPDGGYLATVGDETISCDNVVVATGTFGRAPNVPAFAADVAPSIHTTFVTSRTVPSPAGLGLDPAADPGRAGLANGVPGRRRRRTGTVFLRPVVPVRVRSMVFPGISRDANYVARRIVARSATMERTAA